MDFDELEERQRWALKEIQKTRTRQLQVAAQEQYKQWRSTKPARHSAMQASEAAEAEAGSAPIGLAGFAFAPVWRVRQAEMEPERSADGGNAPATAAEKAQPRRARGFAKFQEMRKEADGPTESEKLPIADSASPVEGAADASDPNDPDPLRAFAQRLMVHAQEERHLERSWEQLQSGECGLPVMTSPQDVDADSQEVPALNALIAILDEEEKEEQDFERLKPYLPELGEKAASSIVAAGKDGSNPFVTQAVEVFQRFYPDVDLSSAFGDHYKEVLHAAAHRSARGRIEHLQLKTVEKAEEERRAQEERRKLLRDLRQRLYLLQERQRALGSLGDTKLSTQASHRLPKALAMSQELCGASNGLLFPGMGGAPGAAPPSGDAGNVVNVCFPRTETSETVPAAKAFQSKPLSLFSSLKLGEDEEPFTLEDLTGLPSRTFKVKSSAPTTTRGRDVPQKPLELGGRKTTRCEREELERQSRAAEQQQRLERLKERRLQRDKAKALEASLPLKGSVTSWGPASNLRF